MSNAIKIATPDGLTYTMHPDTDDRIYGTNGGIAWVANETERRSLVREMRAFGVQDPERYVRAL